MKKDPIFILANPRAGSSAFRLILNSTSTSVFPPECGFIQWLYPTYKEWSVDSISQFTEDVINSKKMEGWNLNYELLLKFIEKNKPNSYGEACALVYKFYGMNQNKEVDIWGDKNNYYIHHLDTISEIYPNAKYIWLRRNPMDICASYLKINDLPNDIQYKPNVSNNIDEIFNEIIKNSETIIHFLDNINTDNKIIINFEDVLLQDTQKLNELSKFTSIDIDSAISNFNKNKYFDEPEITMAWKSKTKTELDSSYVNSYKLHPQHNAIYKSYERIFGNNS